MTITRSLLNRIHAAAKELAHASAWGNSFAKYYMEGDSAEKAKKRLHKAWERWNDLMIEMEQYVNEG